MKYLKHLFKHIYYIKRKMSTFKICIWENYFFVNYVVPSGETDLKMMMSMITPCNKKRKINLCRNANDTLQVLFDRLNIKISHVCGIKNKTYFKENPPLVKVDGVTVPSDTICRDVFLEKNSNITIQVIDNTYKVIVNAPMLNELRLNVPYKGFMLYPYAFDKGYNLSMFNSKYSWYRIESKDVIEVGNKIAYIPTADDINCQLKLVCTPCDASGKFGPSAEIISLKVQDNSIIVYPYENRLKAKPNDSIRIVSYNILAGEYTKTKEAKTEMYPYCTNEVLSNSYRRPLLLNELRAYNADILCLQEVESMFFHRELCPVLKQFMNMSGIFLKKPGHRDEGLSCYYSDEKFDLLDVFSIKLSDITTIEMYCGPVIKDIIKDTLWKKGLEKRTVFQVLLLKLISDQKKLFLICNTHLISTPEGDNIRLLQALIEFTIINQIKENTVNKYLGCNISVIFCGDFNSTPESGVYDLMTKLLLPEKNDNMKILNNLKECLHFKMHSAYGTDIEYSHYTNVFNGLLDYIFFTSKHLELIQVLPMPSHDDVIKHVALPSLLFPSDHLSLIADFKLK